MYRDLTQGSSTKGLLLFAAPMVAGNLLQQLYNIADTLIVGQALGRNALASVGSAFTLMTFLPSVFLGLSMGSGALFSIYLGRHSHRLVSGRRRGIWVFLPLPRPASGGNVLTIFPCRRIRSVVKF